MSSSQLMKVRSRVAGTIIASLFALFATVCPTTARAAETSAAPGVSPDAERAAIAGDWNRTSQLLGKETGRLPAVFRMLLAHAYLATNHSNAALCLLLDTTAPADLREWAVWTERQVKQNPKSPAALYLRGDALARLKQWPEAIKAFTDAETGRKKELDVLIRVAKATALASQKDWQVDRVEPFGLGQAINRKEPLAELYTTHAYLLLLSRGSNTTRARQEFDEANKLSEKAEKSPSIPALQGLAFAKVMVGQWEDARKDLKAATTIDVECRRALEPMLAGSETLVGNAWTNVSVRAVAATAKVKVRPGMNLQEKMDYVKKNFGNLPSDTKQQIADVLNHDYNFNQGVQKFSFLKGEAEFGVEANRSGVGPYGKAGIKAELDPFHDAKGNAAIMGNLLNDIRDKYGIKPRDISDVQAYGFSKGFFDPLPGGVKSDPVCGTSGTPTLGGSCLVPTHDEMRIIPWFEYLYSPGTPVANKAETTASRSPKP